MKKNNQGFTLVEIMIVVAIIGLLAAIAIPNFLKSREMSRMNTCINNLRQIDSAKEQWAITENKKHGDAFEVAAWEFIKGGEPKCPSSGTYTPNAIGTLPTCSESSGDYPHKLPETSTGG